jgi:hypothetical protein
MSECQIYVDTLHQQVCVLKADRMERLDIRKHTIRTLSLKRGIDEDTIHKPMMFTDENQDNWLIGEKGWCLWRKIHQKYRALLNKTLDN